MDFRTQFEEFAQQTIPNVDLTRDPEDQDYYLDGAVHAAWVGFRNLHTTVYAESTNSADNNHDRRENTE